MGDKYDQSGVIAFRERNGEIQVLLVTTSSGKHWTIPKGHIEPKMSASRSAAKEAYEEAGIRGDIIKPAMGTYSYKKNGRGLRVKVFWMEVTQKAAKFPEQHLRQRKWFSLKKAGKKVHRKGLKRLLHDLENRQGPVVPGTFGPNG